MIRRHRRGIFGAGVVVVLAAFISVWALPNVAGAAFVSVRAIVSPTLASGGPTVVVGGERAVQASAVNIAVEIDNGYPLSVVLGTGPTPYQAAVYRRDNAGHLTRVWQVGSGDPTVEEGSDSPVGGGPSGGAVVVPPGSSRHSITDASTTFALSSAGDRSPGPGVYYVRVWAYGIGSSLVPMALDGGVDPLGTPSELPVAPAV